jgi:hypothetical protein
MAICFAFIKLSRPSPPRTQQRLTPVDIVTRTFGPIVRVLCV